MTFAESPTNRLAPKNIQAFKRPGFLVSFQEVGGLLRNDPRTMETNPKSGNGIDASGLRKETAALGLEHGEHGHSKRVFEEIFAVEQLI